MFGPSLSRGSLFVSANTNDGVTALISVLCRPCSPAVRLSLSSVLSTDRFQAYTPSQGEGCIACSSRSLALLRKGCFTHYIVNLRIIARPNNADAQKPTGSFCGSRIPFCLCIQLASTPTLASRCSFPIQRAFSSTPRAWYTGSRLNHSPQAAFRRWQTTCETPKRWTITHHL